MSTTTNPTEKRWQHSVPPSEPIYRHLRVVLAAKAATQALTGQLPTCLRLLGTQRQISHLLRRWTSPHTEVNTRYQTLSHGGNQTQVSWFLPCESITTTRISSDYLRLRCADVLDISWDKSQGASNHKEQNQGTQFS